MQSEPASLPHDREGHLRPPDILYKYLAPEHLISSLKERRLKCTRHAEFDDIFDSFHIEEPRDSNELNIVGSTYYFLELNIADIINTDLTERLLADFNNWVDLSVVKYPGFYVDGVIQIEPSSLAEKGKYLVEGFRQSILSIYNDIYILSLTEDCQNRIMWERYASGSRGFCIGISTSSQIMSPKNGGVLRKIIYSDEPSSGPPEVGVWRRWIVKHPDYAYENEWRLRFFKERVINFTTQQGIEIQTVQFDTTDLKHLIFGARAPSDIVSQAIDLTPSHVEIFRVIPGFKAFSLERIK